VPEPEKGDPMSHENKTNKTKRNLLAAFLATRLLVPRFALANEKPSATEIKEQQQEVNELKAMVKTDREKLQADRGKLKQKKMALKAERKNHPTRKSKRKPIKIKNMYIGSH
jgi:hypothetical protein